MEAIARHRDRDAFARLFSYFAPRLKAHVLARGATDALADEVVQEVMLRVWQRAGQFHATRGAPSTWVFSIARNCFIDLVRKQRPFEPEPEPGEAMANEPAADEGMAHGQSVAALAAAVQQLPAEQGRVLEAAYVAGRSFPEIAAEQGVPLGTVKTRARLALERLRVILVRTRE